MGNSGVRSRRRLSEGLNESGPSLESHKLESYVRDQLYRGETGCDSGFSMSRECSMANGTLLTPEPPVSIRPESLHS